MTEPWDESVEGIEALVLAAEQYVGASEDLRPRVLEAARQQSGEKSVRRRLWHVAVIVLLLALCAPELQQGWSEGQSRWGAIDESEIEVSGQLTPAAGNRDWRLIDAFNKLRREQAQILRFAS